MIEFFSLITGLKGDVDADLLEEFDVHMRKDDAGVRLAAAQGTEFFDGAACNGVRNRADCQRDQQLVGVHAGVVVSEVLYLQFHNRLYHPRGYKLCRIVYAGKILSRI